GVADRAEALPAHDQILRVVGAARCGARHDRIDRVLLQPAGLRVGQRIPHREVLDGPEEPAGPVAGEVRGRTGIEEVVADGARHLFARVRPAGRGGATAPARHGGAMPVFNASNTVSAPCRPWLTGMLSSSLAMHWRPFCGSRQAARLVTPSTIAGHTSARYAARSASSCRYCR